MNGYNFTERVRKVLALAREESHALNHEYVGTEHILLGLMTEGEGIGMAALRNLGIKVDELRQAIGKSVLKGRSANSPHQDLPYTSRAKKVLELAMQEARDLNHSYVGTEHLMIGLIREEEGVAAQVLCDAGVNVESAREEVLRLAGSPQANRGISDDPPIGTPVTGVTLALSFENGSMIRRTFSEVSEAITFLTGHVNKTP